MKNPKEMRARAERYRKHALAITDISVQNVIESVADKLEQEADRMEREAKAQDRTDKEKDL